MLNKLSNNFPSGSDYNYYGTILKNYGKNKESIPISILIKNVINTVAFYTRKML